MRTASGGFGAHDALCDFDIRPQGTGPLSRVREDGGSRSEPGECSPIVVKQRKRKALASGAQRWVIGTAR